MDSAGSSASTPHNLSYMLIAWFPAFVVFVLIPFAVYLPNQKEFGGNLFHPLFSASMALLAFLGVLLLLLVRPSGRARIATVLFFLGVYIVLADILAPIQVGYLMSGLSNIAPSEPIFSQHHRSSVIGWIVVGGHQTATQMGRESRCSICSGTCADSSAVLLCEHPTQCDCQMEGIHIVREEGSRLLPGQSFQERKYIPDLF